MTDPGDPAVGNEDALGIGPRAAVVTDGVTPLDRSARPCRHGVGWYARALAGALADELTLEANTATASGLRAAIGVIRDRHGDGSTCDLGHLDAPSATVAAVRLAGGRLDYLVLADAAVVLELTDRVEVITDDRPERTVRRLRESGAETGGVAVRSGWANRPGGYWVAAADPDVADRALVGSLPAHRVRRAVLLTDGASRLVERFGAYDWGEAVRLIADEGPLAWIARTRRAERAAIDRPGKRHDDATAVLLTPHPTPRSK